MSKSLKLSGDQFVLHRKLLSLKLRNPGILILTDSAHEHVEAHDASCVASPFSHDNEL